MYSLSVLQGLACLVFPSHLLEYFDLVRVEERTYLYAGVDIVETYRCFNLPARELEDRLHTFFDQVRLNINIPDEKGAVISPREGITPFANATTVSIEHFTNQGTFNDLSGASLFFPGKSFTPDTPPQIE